MSEWENAWAAYVWSLARLDVAQGRDGRRGARLAVARARKALWRLDPDFMNRIGFDVTE